MNDETLLAITVPAVILTVLATFLFAPLLWIWSLNTLFGLAIPYTFKTWAAMLTLVVVLAGRKVTVARRS